MENNSNTTVKTCQHCHKQVRGRIDKKFCSDVCRNAFHNAENATTNNYVRNIIHVLTRNRRILEKLLENRKTRTVNHDLLATENFRFGFVTQHRQCPDKTPCYYCFEYGWEELKVNTYRIFKLDKTK